ncbi:MAG: serine hydrolase, partial [Bacteroidetes bacterium]|nr:serine hydrolase [Bacteroidota bacterium]
NKENLTFREMLAHQAGLTAWIPYWKDAVNKEGNFRKQVFRRDSSQKYPYKVANHLYLKEDYRKKIFRAIKKSPVLKEKKYLYSGLSFYLYPTIIEKITGSDYQEYLKENFYHPLGAFTLTYMPQQYYPLHRVVPTEYDFPFRGEIIHGKVHDEGAAMMNGVSANAGLFGTSNDLAKLFQMYLNMGEYGGKRYISENTLREFTKYQFPENENRRGLGFDKPQLEYDANGTAAKDASKESFGHTGYTGGRAWADPKHQLVYIFLSNRVHPSRENTRLYKLNTRTNIEQVIYDSFLTK